MHHTVVCMCVSVCVSGVPLKFLVPLFHDFSSLAVRTSSTQYLKKIYLVFSFFSFFLHMHLFF
jgi:hypothetical protein